MFGLLILKSALMKLLSISFSCRWITFVLESEVFIAESVARLYNHFLVFDWILTYLCTFKTLERYGTQSLCNPPHDQMRSICVKKDKVEASVFFSICVKPVIVYTAIVYFLKWFKWFFYSTKTICPEWSVWIAQFNDMTVHDLKI